MIKDDGSVIHFNNPKVQASLNANTFAVSGHAESKQVTEMLPGILNHLGAEGFNQLKRLASSVSAGMCVNEVIFHLLGVCEKRRHGSPHVLC